VKTVSLVKSFSVDNGDMYYIRHGSDNFTVIDCNIPADRLGSMLAEISTQSSDKGIRRFISTHPDQDHISGLVELDDQMKIVNFYCVANQATKENPTADFKRYCELRDGPKAFHIYEGCSRRWMNEANDERGSAGINILWPDVNDTDYKGALADAANGLTPNNISCIIKYALEGGVTMLWMGDLETDFMEKIETKVAIPAVDILFAPHHGRDSGKVPKAWLDVMNPSLIVIGEAPSEYLNYYQGYDTLTQNSTGDMLFDCIEGKAHIYVEDHNYVAACLDDEGKDHEHGLYYVGTLQV
jgi:hypothetical protein